MSNYVRFYNNAYHYVFITLVTQSRVPILLDNIQLLRNSFIYTKSKFQYEIFACSILKDHLHTIFKLENPKDYSEIIRQLKYYFSLKMKTQNSLSDSKIKKREKGIWQRRFWEHTIRDENDLNKHIDYIHYNSYKHYKISPKDWEFSTFPKFVNKGYYDAQWCNFNDENKILELDFE